MKCPNCNGTGIDAQTRLFDAIHNSKLNLGIHESCITCAGTGEVTDPEDPEDLIFEEDEQE